jgi:predicted DNA-binding transcriptional regulator AlpA
MIAGKSKQLHRANVARQRSLESKRCDIRKARDLTSLDHHRLGWRIREWMRLTGTSRPTLWRQVKRGDLKIVYVGPTPMVPRSEAIRLGLLSS